MERSALVRELTANANKRLECYNTLIGLADEQRTIMLGNEHSRLPENLAKFDPLFLEVKRLERNEEALLAQLAESGDNDDPGYAATRARILEAANVLQSITITNKELITSHMQYVNFTLGLIFKTAAEHSTACPGDNPAILLDFRV